MNTTTTPPDARLAAMQAALTAVIETVREAGDTGAPAGILYAAFMAKGMSLANFEAMMGALVTMRKLTKRGHVYFSCKQDGSEK